MSKKIYFASDFHLGIDALETSVIREKKIVRWLENIEDDVDTLYLVGDVFDHWFEYKNTIPKGFNRLLGKLADYRDKNIPIHFFTGNHDMWMFTYLEKEFGIPIHRQPIEVTHGDKRFFIGHGDGLGPKDYGYKMIKSIFNNRICQSTFNWLHPDIGLPLMRFFSTKSREYTADDSFSLNPNDEWLVQFVEKHSKTNAIDYYIFGHRHLPIYYPLTNGKSIYYNLGEWMYASSFGVFDGQNFEIQFYESYNTKIYGI